MTSRWAYFLTSMVLMTIFMMAFGTFVMKPAADWLVDISRSTIGIDAALALMALLILGTGIYAYRANKS